MEDQAGQNQTWWQKNKRFLIIATVVIIVLLFSFALAVILFGWDWTGFTSITGPTVHPNEQYRPAKTMWDVLQLLIVPIILAIGVFWLNQLQKSREEKATKQRAEDEQKIATDNQHEMALQTYIDKMSELLLKEGLRESQPNDEVRKIARVQTLTVLRRLDEWRKRNVLEFLYEASLINKDEPIKPIVELKGAYFLQANLKWIDLKNADLRGALCWKVDFSEAKLNGVDLREVQFREVVFNGTDLSGANLYKAIFQDPDGKPRKDAADIIIKELEKQAKSLKDATMPDGSIHQ